MIQEMHKGALAKHFFYARENRKQSTKAEQVLWNCLKGRKLHGFKFRRQHPISDFIADFYCHECKLVIELDGDYHNVIEQRQYDKGRTYELNELKLKVIRFTNREVLEIIEYVLDEITAQLFQFVNENYR